ncbi:RlpA-like double-psi beta-barrel-protein domain-containing protein-containing protein [Talaromyces proteolyticus]|uniref:RlpA-like double-psi beta-barrel-protein domain-containing protein-containing protein n=1 Tax=Talaromyces proteolyticus TaxID=1131652 RepID=A0AAD4PXI3_9EURO|nr:RlpA-like double-psi beta-barrel-protein domain-containing protein-containing protein [Talaromyces proteolyticus]KAH8693166.1 RlpA-like double-psi beta-barrel-protein domain-containing protein-containing protein [Talaromyces proteolyticus]
MAIFSKALALTAILATLTSAAPLQQKRDLVYETVTAYDVTTIDTTITLYPGEPTPSVPPNVAITTQAAVSTTAPAEAKPEPTSATSTSVSPVAPETTAAPTTTAPAAAPTSEAPAAAPTTTEAPSPAAEPSTTSTSSSAPAATSSGSSGSGNGQSGSGDGTYYDTATSMSAPSYCDTANDGNSENVVALSSAIMTEALCGATITVHHNGNSATGKVVDKCPGCSAGSVDMSQHMFESLASIDAGRIPITWTLN